MAGLGLGCLEALPRYVAGRVVWRSLRLEPLAVHETVTHAEFCGLSDAWRRSRQEVGAAKSPLGQRQSMIRSSRQPPNRKN